MWVVETRLSARLIFIKPKCIVETRLKARLFRRSLFEVGRIDLHILSFRRQEKSGGFKKQKSFFTHKLNHLNCKFNGVPSGIANSAQLKATFLFFDLDAYKVVYANPLSG